MQPMLQPVQTCVLLIALMATAVLCAALLRWARGPSSALPNTAWSILGGVLAGVLLGPTIFGRVLPSQYESGFLGGVAERTLRDQLVRRHEADRLAAAHAHVDQSQVDELNLQFESELAQTTRTWRDAQWSHQTSQRWFTFALVAIALLA